MNQEKKMSVAKLVEELKVSNEDFEWYPTTKEIIEAMYWDIRGDKREDESVYRCNQKNISILDIGAGNCKLFSTFKEIANKQPVLNEYYERSETERNYRNDYERLTNRVSISKYMAIEKSQTLIDAMPHDVFIVGTEFNENTLIDKRADVVFCNPPYSQYAQWTERIIKEANADYIYLVIPQRWGTNKSIAQALKARKATVELVGSFDFLDSEDRKARAKVSLLKVTLAKEHSDYRSDNKIKVDPFDLWFNETFKVEADKASDGYESDYTIRQAAKASHKDSVEDALVDGHDLVTTLVELYNHKLNYLIGNYKKVTELDPDILKELSVKVDALKGGLKEKISGLKVLYWEEIFENLEQITSRLTSRSRDSMLKTLMANTSIDFTASNVYSVVVWAIKNANKYFDQQMIEVYDNFSSDEGLKYYKSNTHFVKDSWRYCRDEDKKGIKYSLEYRIVLHDFMDSYSKTISTNQRIKILDLAIVAKNLGFSVDSEWVASPKTIYMGEKENIFFHTPKGRKLERGTKTHLGKIQEVFEIPEESQAHQGHYQYQIDGRLYNEDLVNIDEDIFTTVKAFKKGTVHYQMNQKFIKKLNLEVGRLRGWIKSPAEAAEEFDISEEEANEYWNSSFQMLPSGITNLLPSAPTTVNGPDEVINENETVIAELLETVDVEQFVDAESNEEIIVQEPAIEANTVGIQLTLFDDVA